MPRKEILQAHWFHDMLLIQWTIRSLAEAKDMVRSLQHTKLTICLMGSKPFSSRVVFTIHLSWITRLPFSFERLCTRYHRNKGRLIPCATAHGMSLVSRNYDHQISTHASTHFSQVRCHTERMMKPDKHAVVIRWVRCDIMCYTLILRSGRGTMRH